MTNKPGGGEGHQPDPLSVAIDLPLAKVSELVAIQYRTTLIISCTGGIVGFDGSLAIVKSDTRIYPPMFSVFSRPGNCGITGECPAGFQGVVTQAFDGKYREIQVVTADGTLRPKIRHALDALPEVAGLDATSAAPSKDEGSQFGWSAWINMMPMAERTLYVVGRLMMPTPGFKLKLTRAVPQGINPTVLLLDLEVERPKDFVNQVLTPIDVRYEEKVEGALFTSVHIRNTGVVIPVEYVW